MSINLKVPPKANLIGRKLKARRVTAYFRDADEHLGADTAAFNERTSISTWMIKTAVRIARLEGRENRTAQMACLLAEPIQIHNFANKFAYWILLRPLFRRLCL